VRLPPLGRDSTASQHLGAVALRRMALPNNEGFRHSGRQMVAIRYIPVSNPENQVRCGAYGRIHERHSPKVYRRTTRCRSESYRTRAGHSKNVTNLASPCGRSLGTRDQSSYQNCDRSSSHHDAAIREKCPCRA